MSDYQSREDFKYLACLLKSAPNETQAFIDFDQQTIKRNDGNIPIKIRLIISHEIVSFRTLFELSSSFTILAIIINSFTKVLITLEM